MKRIVVMLDGFIQRDVLTDKAQVTIGRNADNDIQIDNPGVSGVHARLTLLPAPTVEDLGSTNGTSVAGVRIDGLTPLRPGAMIGILRYQIYLLDEKKSAGAARETTLKV